MRWPTTGRLRKRTISNAERWGARLVVVVLAFVGACADEDAQRDWEEYCQVENDQCPVDCDPVISKNSWIASGGVYDGVCSKDGVLVGCIPGRETEYWHNRAYTEIARICTQLVSAPDYRVCYEGSRITSWVMGHAHLFCIDTACPPPRTGCEPHEDVD